MFQFLADIDKISFSSVHLFSDGFLVGKKQIFRVVMVILFLFKLTCCVF